MTRATFAAAFTLIVSAGLWSLNAATAPQAAAPLEFVGTTPCGDAYRAFLGSMDAGAACHAITWRIRLAGPADGRGAWTLTATYGVPPPSNPNLMIDGPKVALKGTWATAKWATAKGTTQGRSALVYRLTSDAQRTIAFVSMSDEIVHMLADDDRLMLGTAGWSYTLNRADRLEQPGNPATAPDMSYTISPRGSGSAVFGVFEGRTPCVGIARELKINQVAGCLKVKWRVTLFKNAQTGQPTTYKIEGTLHRASAREGTWQILRTTSDPRPGAIAYHLDATATEAPLLLWRGDDRVLFFQGQDGSLLVGNADFSYTLNRVGP